MRRKRLILDLFLLLNSVAIARGKWNFLDGVLDCVTTGNCSDSKDAGNATPVSNTTETTQTTTLSGKTTPGTLNITSTDRAGKNATKGKPGKNNATSSTMTKEATSNSTPSVFGIKDETEPSNTSATLTVTGEFNLYTTDSHNSPSDGPELVKVDTVPPVVKIPSVTLDPGALVTSQPKPIDNSLVPIQDLLSSLPPIAKTIPNDLTIVPALGTVTESSEASIDPKERAETETDDGYTATTELSADTTVDDEYDPGEYDPGEYDPDNYDYCEDYKDFWYDPGLYDYMVANGCITATTPDPNQESETTGAYSTSDSEPSINPDVPPMNDRVTDESTDSDETLGSEPSTEITQEPNSQDYSAADYATDSDRLETAETDETDLNTGKTDNVTSKDDAEDSVETAQTDATDLNTGVTEDFTSNEVIEDSSEGSTRNIGDEELTSEGDNSTGADGGFHTTNPETGTEVTEITEFTELETSHTDTAENVASEGTSDSDESSTVSEGGTTDDHDTTGNTGSGNYGGSTIDVETKKNGRVTVVTVTEKEGMTGTEGLHTREAEEQTLDMADVTESTEDEVEWTTAPMDEASTNVENDKSDQTETERVPTKTIIIPGTNQNGTTDSGEEKGTTPIQGGGGSSEDPDTTDDTTDGVTDTVEISENPNSETVPEFATTSTTKEPLVTITKIIRENVTDQYGNATEVTKIEVIPVEKVTTLLPGNSTNSTEAQNTTKTEQDVEFATDSEGNLVTRIISVPTEEPNARSTTSSSTKNNGNVTEVTQIDYVNVTVTTEATTTHALNGTSKEENTTTSTTTSLPQTVTRIVRQNTTDTAGNPVEVTVVEYENVTKSATTTTEFEQEKNITVTSKPANTTTQPPQNDNVTTTSGDWDYVTMVTTDEFGNEIIVKVPRPKTTKIPGNGTVPRNTTTAVASNVTTTADTLETTTEVFVNQTIGYCNVSALDLRNAAEINAQTEEAGASIMHACLDNFSFNDSSTSRVYTCQMNGTWQGYDPGNICLLKMANGTVVTCPDPAELIDLTNAKLPAPDDKEIKGAQVVGTMIVHQCSGQYVFQSLGQPVQIYECKKDGAWTKNMKGEPCSLFVSPNARMLRDVRSIMEDDPVAQLPYFADDDDLVTPSEASPLMALSAVIDAPEREKMTAKSDGLLSIQFSVKLQAIRPHNQIEKCNEKKDDSKLDKILRRTSSITSMVLLVISVILNIVFSSSDLHVILAVFQDASAIWFHAIQVIAFGLQKSSRITCFLIHHGSFFSFTLVSIFALIQSINYRSVRGMNLVNPSKLLHAICIVGGIVASLLLTIVEIFVDRSTLDTCFGNRGCLPNVLQVHGWLFFPNTSLIVLCVLIQIITTKSSTNSTNLTFTSIRSSGISIPVLLCMSCLSYALSSLSAHNTNTVLLVANMLINILTAFCALLAHVAANPKVFAKMHAMK